jgi:hypothetical protein
VVQLAQCSGVLWCTVRYNASFSMFQTVVTCEEVILQRLYRDWGRSEDVICPFLLRRMNTSTMLLLVGPMDAPGTTYKQRMLLYYAADTAPQGPSRG